MNLNFQLSPEMAALMTGFSSFHGQTVDQYALAALVAHVQSDCQADHSDGFPEADKVKALS